MLEFMIACAAIFAAFTVMAFIADYVLPWLERKSRRSR